MATSLAAQLKRLAAPQTKVLTQDKKRPSFLFDPKEAATKDRDTIFAIGVSGLEELKLRNPKFELFEATLFSSSSKNFQRSVVSSEVNLKLDKNIKRFLLLLSPHFLQPAAHKCLEWLINRFLIHDFNKNELFMLILPYHETRYFARCVQLMDISENSDRWNWLYVLQKAGAPLSKTALLNRCANDNLMLKFVCDLALEAIKELENRSNTLSTIFAFYCTSLIGALEYTNSISENQVTTILPSLLKALSSEIKDFVASSYMVIGQLVLKTKLSKMLLEQIVIKVCQVQHIALRTEAMLLLTLIYYTQREVFSEIPVKMLNKLAVSKWFPIAMGQLVASGSNIISFLIPLLKACLLNAQTNEGNTTENAKTLVQNLLIEVKLQNEDVETLIRCVINSFISELPPTDVINLDSDSEMETDNQELEASQNQNAQSWYCECLKSIENKYPEQFDNVIKNIMRSKRNDASKTSLKNILGLLPNTSHGVKGNTSMFENLYSHNPKIRLAAVKYIVAKSGEIDMTKNELLKNSIVERLSDENPQIVKAVLRLKFETLLSIISWAELQEILIATLDKCHKDKQLWWTAAANTLKLLCSRHSESDELQIFFAIFPFLLPTSEVDIVKVQIILKSKFGHNCMFIKKLASMLENQSTSKMICSCVFDLLEGNVATFNVNSLMDSYPKEKEINHLSKFLSLLLVTSTLPEHSDIEISCRALEFSLKIAMDTETHFKLLIDGNAITSDNIQDCINICLGGKLPVEILIHCLNSIIRKTNVPSTYSLKFSEYNHTAQYFVTLFEVLVAASSAKNSSIILQYARTLKNFFNKYARTITATGEFISNFFSPLTVYSNDTTGKDITISPELQLRSLRLAYSLFSRTSESLQSILDSKVFVQNILIALTNPTMCIRKCALDLLEVMLSKCNTDSGNHFYLLTQIFNHKEEILLDHEQLPLILYITLSPENMAGKKITQMKNEECLKAMYSYIVDKNSPLHISSTMLKIFTLVNSETILNTVAKLGLTILEYGNTISKPLDKSRSLILQNIMCRINKDTIRRVEANPVLWNYITKCLQSHNMNVTLEDDNIGNISVLLMDQIDNDIYLCLPKSLNAELLSSIIDCATDSEDPNILSAASKIIKRIELDGTLIKNELQLMRDAKNPETDTDKDQKRRSRRINVAPQPALLLTRPWKRGVTLLEFIQNKKKINDFGVMLPMIFDVLKRCLEFDIQAPVEYTKQLLLSCILHCCNKISTSGCHVKELPENAFNIELVVQCIRATSNPQTHHHALMVLCQMAGIVPEQVLHNMMAIFTFMGSSVLRHDDAYSFQIITKLIDTVIPILVEYDVKEDLTEEKATVMYNRVIPLLRVFVSVLLDIPEHRRIPLFKKLLDTLNPEHFLWLFLGLVFESQVLHPNSSTEKSICQRRLDIASTLTREYPPNVVIQSCNKLLLYLKTLPVEKDHRGNSDPRNTLLFDYSLHTPKQLRHYKYTLITFISNVISSPLFVNTLAMMNDMEMSNLEDLYKTMIVHTLTYVQILSKIMDKNVGKPQAKYWKVMLHHTYDILDSINGLLSPDMFLLVIKGLMNHNIPTVRRKSMELLISRLQHNITFFDTCNKTTLYGIIDPLTKVVTTINSDNEMDGTNALELAMNQQTALLALKLLSKLLGPVHPLKFKPVLDLITELTTSTSIQRNVLASVVLCLAELCNNLGSQSIPSLSKFMPALLNVLKSQKNIDTIDLLLVSTVTALQKIIESLALFLSPYLEKMLFQLALLETKFIDHNSAQAVSFCAKLKTISQKISNSIAPRVLIPAVKDCYDKLIKKQKYNSVGYIMKMLSESFSNISGADFTALQMELTNFFLEALQFRSDLAAEDISQEEVATVEEYVIKALVTLILKLSESSFKPLYYRLYDWATTSSTSKDRSITFYRLSSQIAERLKGLFILFAGCFIENACSLLDKCNVIKTDDLYFNSPEKCIVLIESIMKTFHSVFLYDSQNFVNKELFEIIIQPLVDQLENKLGDEFQKRAQAIVTPCIAQFAVAAGDDSLWKQLNYQVLLKTRHEESEIRLCALDTTCEIARKVGEDFLPLLPETIPFLAELLEDEDPKIESSCQKAIQQLETFIGEPLQKYF